MVRLCLALLWAGLAMPLMAQQIETDPDVRRADKALVGGAHLHTFGWGFDLQYSKRLTNQWDRYELKLAFALSSFKDRDEGRVNSIYTSFGGRDFIFGKRYYAYFLGMTGGFQRILIERSEFNRVQVKGGLLIGPTMAILKPYLVDIVVQIAPNSNLAELVPAIYDPVRPTNIRFPNPRPHEFGDVYGQSDYFQGFDRITTRWGLRVRSDFTVDLSGSSYFVRAINFGLQMDMFPRQVPIMLTDNQQTYFSAYAGLVFGSAW